MVGVVPQSFFSAHNEEIKRQYNYYNEFEITVITNFYGAPIFHLLIFR